MTRFPSVVVASFLTIAACGDDDPTNLADGGAGGVATQGGGGHGENIGGGGGEAPTCDSLTCGDDQFCYAGSCRDCAVETGTLHDRTLALGDDEEDRYYMLHVPTTYECGSAAPVLVDFHGTAAGPGQPEEAYQLDALIALSEAKGVIVVRPRSRSSARGGAEIYRWDQNPGDLERNVTFTQNLVEHLRSTYHIDEQRIYAAGFSSGSNMTSQFLGPARGLFKGLAPIAGGIWSDPGIDPFDQGTAPRVYAATGYRDYLHGTRRDLLELLQDAGVPEDQVVVREYDTGHDLYEWHFPELWAFLDEGTRPGGGELSPDWIAEELPSPGSVLTLTTRADGTLVATGSDGQVWLRSEAGDWILADTLDVGVLSGACADGEGNMFLVGERDFIAGSADLTFQAPKTVPEFFGTYFGTSYLNGIGCASGTALAAGGYWTGVRSADGGDAWLGLGVDAGGYAAQSSAVHVSDIGTIVAVGYYDYIGRGAAGAEALVPIDHPAGAEWLTDATSAPGGKHWVVGDRGVILASTDDGLVWEQQISNTAEDLYAIAFASDGLTGAAVGRLGAILVTLDGGETWEDRSAGLDVFLGAAAFQGNTVFVAGERGLVLRADLTD